MPAQVQYFFVLQSTSPIQANCIWYYNVRLRNIRYYTVLWNTIYETAFTMGEAAVDLNGTKCCTCQENRIWYVRKNCVFYAERITCFILIT